MNYYFITRIENEFQFFDSNFQRLDQVRLDGLFAFIQYNNPELIVIGELLNYRTKHHGLATFVEVLRKHAIAFRDHFFKFQSKPSAFYLPKDKPTIGGEVLYLWPEVVYWNVKSKSISFENPDCHDTSPKLNNIINSVGFPPTRFVRVKQADFFEKEHLRELFSANGQYKNVNIEVANKICKIMELTPLYQYGPSSEEDLQNQPTENQPIPSA